LTLANKFRFILHRIAQIINPTPAPETIEWEMSGKDWVALIAASLAAFMALIDIQIINSSLQLIESNLGMDFADGSWISTAYLISEVMVIPLTPILVDSLGLRTYLILGSALFGFSSVLCALSWNLPSIATFRFIQGFFGGTLIPVIFQMILIYMPSHRRNVGLSIFGLIATLAPTIGPSVGGYIATYLGWRWIFFINIFASALVIALTSISFPKTEKSLRILRRADWIGALLICSALGCLTFALEEGGNREWFNDSLVTVCIFITVICLPAFVIFELKKKTKPLLELRLFRSREFSLCTLITFLAAQCLYGGMYALSIFLGAIHGYSPLEIGSILAWAGIPQIFIIPFLPILMRKVDGRILAIVGLALFAWSNWNNTGINNDYGGNEFRWTLIQRAISQPFFTISLSALAIQKIVPSMAGAASSFINMIRNLGGSVGIALVSYIINIHSSKYSEILQSLLNPIAPSMSEQVTIMKNMLFVAGQDPSLAEIASNKMISSQILRESYFHCFNEVFEILTIELLIAGVLVLLIPKPAPSKLGSTQAIH